MKPKIKEAYKLIEKYEKKQKKKAEESNFSMFEKAGCSQCSNGQKYSGGRTELDITYYTRCTCANKKTKKYVEFLDKKEELMEVMTAKDYELLYTKWYDNNSHITIGNNAVNRSW